VTELKEELKQRGLNSNGTKAVLEERLEEAQAEEAAVKKRKAGAPTPSQKGKRAASPRHKKKAKKTPGAETEYETEAEVEDEEIAKKATPKARASNTRRKKKAKKTSGAETEYETEAEVEGVEDGGEAISSPLKQAAHVDRKTAELFALQAKMGMAEAGQQLGVVRSSARTKVSQLLKAAERCKKPLEVTGITESAAKQVAEVLRDVAEVAAGMVGELEQLAKQALELADDTARADKAAQRAAKRTMSAAEAFQFAQAEAAEDATFSKTTFEEFESAMLLVPKEYSTIQEAIDAAKAGDKVCVASGTYSEQIRVDKRLEISGMGPKSSIIVRHDGSGAAICLEHQGCRLANMTIRQEGKGKSKQGALPNCGIRIIGNDAEVHECDTSSSSGGGIHIIGATAKVSWCEVHKCHDNGMLIDRKANVNIEDCTAEDNGRTGYSIVEADAVLQRCIGVRNLQGIGVFGKSSTVKLESNQLRGNREANLHIDNNCKSRVKLENNVTD